jgi:hypothetical protein
MKLHIYSGREFASGLDLPWGEPLETWDLPSMVRLSRGLSRNVVRFVSYRDVVFAVKEIAEYLAVREYGLLRELVDLGQPVVEPICLVTERAAGAGADPRVRDKALLVTRYLDRSLPLRSLITSGGGADQVHNLMDAVAELLVRLHLAGFFWGDCSLSNTLFRLDAGRFAAYLVDAETGELHERLSPGQRQHELIIAGENLAGELMDLDAGFGLPEGVDPVELAMSVDSRYERLWDVITRDEIYPVEESYRIEARVRRLNQLGFDVQDLEIETLDDGRHIRMHADVVEPGYHRRLVKTLTGLDVQENQARRLLNDMYSFRAWQTGVQGQDIPETVSAYRWISEIYQPTLAAIPDEERAKLDDAEIFHQILEHRWYMSEREGREVGLDEVIPDYVDNVLSRTPAPKVESNPLAVSDAGVPPPAAKSPR